MCNVSNKEKIHDLEELRKKDSDDLVEILNKVIYELIGDECYD